MPYHIVVEDIEPFHWVAWVMDQPGCFATAPSEEEVIEQIEEAVFVYSLWREEHADPISLEEPLAVQIDERFHSFLSAPDYRVNACFQADRLPLTTAEVNEGCRILQHTRRDLLEVLQAASLHDVEIWQIVRHIAQAERWYFENLGLEQVTLDADDLTALDIVRRQSILWLRQLVGNAAIHENQQETWTARKILRRTIWHERDHTQHIRQLLADKGTH